MDVVDPLASARDMLRVQWANSIPPRTDTENQGVLCPDRELGVTLK